MSYKKIVAGVATFAVAASMVVPAAFAYTADEYNKFAETNVSAEQKAALKDAAAKALDVTVAKAAVTKAEAEVTKAQKAYDDADAEGKAAAKTTLAEKQAALVDAKDALKTAEKAFEAAEKAAAGAVTAAKTADAVAPADKKANEHVEASLKKAEALEVKIGAINLTSLEKTYKQQVRTLQEGLKQLKAAVAALDGYKDKAPNEKEALAQELDAVMARLNKALGEIKDVDLEKATDKAKLAKKGAKKSGKLPKTGEQAPVAPFAAAGAAALIAAGLVASRKVNA